MTMTPEMYLINERIHELREMLQKDPNDYMISFEFDELVARYDMLEKIERLGWKIVKGGRQCQILEQEKDVKTS